MIGRIFRNRYEIEALLGDGSTAVVYRARDRRLGRVVALKVLLPQVKETVRRRFFQEATAVAALNHPNIMAIYDADEENGSHFLVVEYVEGESLANFVPTSPETAVELGAQIAHALHFAHDRDIIHRDIKPANIKVTPQGQIKIMDLGLALPREGKRVTAEGMIIGTPAYLSPEQAQGQVLDRRTDVYSLGIVLYEMLTGQLPFESDDIPALLLQHVKQPPPPPRMIQPSIPALERVILMALEKQPARRYATAEIFANALRTAMTAGSALDAPTQMSRPANFDAALHAAALVRDDGNGNAVAADAAEETIRHAPPRAETLSNQSAPPTRDEKRKTIRLVLADDHQMLRSSLANFLSTRDDMYVVGQAANGDEALVQVAAKSPDVLLLDLNMPGKGGLDILPVLRREQPQVRVLVLTGRDEDWYITQALRAGAHGYVLKSAGEDDLIDGILRVAAGNLVLGEGIAEKVVTGMLRADEQKLTEPEREMLIRVAAGYENDAIATHMGWTMAQMIEGLAKAMNKLGARDRHSAALKALRRGDILLDELHLLER